MWTAERTATATKLWADGFSATQIAIELGGGLSRNAVIGKVHRMGLPRRQTVSFRTQEGRIKRLNTPKSDRNRVSASLLGRIAKPPKFLKVPIPEPVAPSLAFAIGFSGLGPTTCRYPLWSEATPSAEQFYCGAPHAEEAGPYCPFHHRRTHRATNED